MSLLEKGDDEVHRHFSGREKPEWVSMDPEEIVSLIVKMGRRGVPPSQIGMTLRDVYGIPSVKQVLGKRISDVLEEQGVAQKIPEDLLSLMKKAYKIRKHLEIHRKDFHSKRGLQLTESKIRRLVKYYKRTGKLPEDWRYDPSMLEMIIT
ncbi:MAG TPA: 30S ribosomal protein S15 [Candidatus Korarchaeota archaeon]|nr:30S ribosomal protein S15 [Candidatus Korarchaeota archaeon]